MSDLPSDTEPAADSPERWPVYTDPDTLQMYVQPPKPILDALRALGLLGDVESYPRIP